MTIQFNFRATALLLLATVLVANNTLASEAYTSLSLSTAETIAEQRDLVLQSQQAESQSYREKSAATDNWPDPVLRFGALAVPVDSFDLEQEQMTQVVLGYRQMLPRGSSTEVGARKWLAMADMAGSSREVRKRQLRKNVRNAWLNVYLQERTHDIINTNRELFQQLVKVSQSQYVAGRKKQQDVLQAEVELSLVEDQLEKAEADLEAARAALAQWVGVEKASLPLDRNTDFLQALMLTENQMSQQLLLEHPAVQRQDAMINVAEQDVSLAQEKSGSQWGFDVAYGIRQGDNPAAAGGGERPDFLSVLALVSIPVFGDSKQQREIVASQQLLQSKRFLRDDVLRMLDSQLSQVKVRWYKTIERIARYEEKVLPQAKQNAKAAMSAYQSGVGSFVALTRARVSEFKAQLSHIKLVVEKARLLAQIRYLVGEE